MNETGIVLADYADLDEIMKIVEQAQAFIRSQGFEQWTDGYPTKEQFVKDIDKKSCYVLRKKNQIVGFMSLLFEKEEAYDDLDGKWLTDFSYGVIHRTAIAENFRGCHAVQSFFEFAQAKAIEKKIHSLRIDTHEMNFPMRKSAERFGFLYCGKVSYGPNKPRVAYEKEVIF